MTPDSTVPSDTDRLADWETDPDVLTWDHREQPDFDKLRELLARHGVTVAEIDTQSDQYALQFGTAIPGPTAAANPDALVRECKRLLGRVSSLQGRLDTAEGQLATARELSATWLRSAENVRSSTERLQGLSKVERAELKQGAIEMEHCAHQLRNTVGLGEGDGQ